MLSEVPRDVGRSEIAAEKKSGNPSGTLSSLPLNQSLDAPCSEVTDKECTAEDPENTGWWNWLINSFVLVNSNIWIFHHLSALVQVFITFRGLTTLNRVGKVKFL